jgi:hypothetical protein
VNVENNTSKEPSGCVPTNWSTSLHSSGCTMMRERRAENYKFSSSKLSISSIYVIYTDTKFK